jgi:hypothetical protein
MAGAAGGGSSAAAAAARLLPKDVDDFRSAAYWREFFEARGGAAFEWYADAAPVLAAVAAAVPDLSGRVLVPGCGNSDL